ncbi:Ergothioneine biosynthesis protein 1 [Fusarium oxysporum f. sp. albedinis]|nr:Ergothioneine biosynthesis protein 1 [Fusarium oxysporum f. sp. albedinis]
MRFAWLAVLLTQQAEKTSWPMANRKPKRFRSTLSVVFQDMQMPSRWFDAVSGNANMMCHSPEMQTGDCSE